MFRKNGIGEVMITARRVIGAGRTDVSPYFMHEFQRNGISVVED